MGVRPSLINDAVHKRNSYQLSVTSYQLQEQFGNNLPLLWNIPKRDVLLKNTS